MSSIDFSVALPYLPVLLSATVLTVFLAVVTQIIGTVLGLLLALGRTSHYKSLRGATWTYVWIVRGTPVLLHLFFVYYAAPMFGLTLSALPAAIIALSMSSAAYNAEIIRSGLQAVHPGQVEAAQAVGMSYWRIVRHVVLPQATRIVVPPYMNNFISHTKNTSLASVITVPELMLTAQTLYSSTYRAVEILTLAGLIYLILTTLLTGLQMYLERTLAFDRRGLSSSRRRALGLLPPRSEPPR